MNHLFVWNTISFESANDDNIYALLQNAASGITRVAQSGDRASLYFDAQDSLANRKISTNKTFGSFIEYLISEGEHDLALVLLDMEDKADALDTLSDDELLEASQKSYYFYDLGYSGSLDYLSLALHLDAILFGVASDDIWQAEIANVGIYPPPSNNYKPIAVKCINSDGHGQLIRESIDAASVAKLSSDRYPNCHFSEHILGWFDSLSPENKGKIIQKIDLANARNFDGGEPLFKTLKNAGGIREIRLSAHPGGAIRILFSATSGNKNAILTGFIKKSSNEGYDENIQIASSILEEFKKPTSS